MRIVAKNIYTINNCCHPPQTNCKRIAKYFLAISLLVFFCACNKTNDSNTTTSNSFAKGADISWVTEMEAAGIKFYDSSGMQKDAFALVQNLGMNTVRLRVWVNPTSGWNNKADLLAKALRAKALNMRLLIDFHYSDTWADPANQTKPAAWSSLNFTDLKSAMANHTIDVLQTLKNAGVQPEWVQVGNEINDGMLWPDGKASINMASFAQLQLAGYNAVKTVFPSAKVIVHLSDGWNNSLYRWLLDGLQQYGGKWDVIGLSLYPSPINWQSLTSQCTNNMTDLIVRYGSEIMVVEVGMPWDAPNDCFSFLSTIINNTKALPGNKGLGVLYWEPLAYNNWQGYTLGALDNNGKPTLALKAFR